MNEYMTNEVTRTGRVLCRKVVLAFSIFLLLSSACAAASESTIENDLSRAISTSIFKDDFDSFVKLVDSDEVANIEIYGKPMAIVVIRHRRVEMFRYLLDHGLNIDATGKFGRPLAFHVMTRKYDEFLELLLDYGLDPNTTWGVGNTMANMAFIQNRDHTLSLLLDRGADPNVLLPYSTLLTSAVKKGNVVMVEVLLAHEADPHVINRFSEKTACDIALENRVKYSKIWKLMETPCEQSKL